MCEFSHLLKYEFTNILYISYLKKDKLKDTNALYGVYALSRTPDVFQLVELWGLQHNSTNKNLSCIILLNSGYLIIILNVHIFLYS